MIIATDDKTTGYVKIHCHIYTKAYSFVCGPTSCHTPSPRCDTPL